MRASLILTLLLFGCGPLVNINYQDPRGLKTTHPNFIEFVQEFEDLYGKELADMPVNYGDLPTNKAGRCTVYAYSGRRAITIDGRLWGASSYIRKRVLMLHELGHCILDREHIGDIDSEDAAVSIMHPNLNKAVQAFMTDEQLYLDELFDNR